MLRLVPEVGQGVVDCTSAAVRIGEQDPGKFG